MLARLHSGLMRGNALAWTLITFGLILAAISYLTKGNGWVSAAALELGAAVVLVVPVVYVEQRLERRVTTVFERTVEVEAAQQKTADAVVSLAVDVQAARNEVRDAVADLSARVAARVSDERAATERTFIAVTDDPCYDNVVAALQRSKALGLFSVHGPRIDLRPSSHAVRVHTEEDLGKITALALHLESLSGLHVDEVPWLPDDDIADVFARVADMLVRNRAVPDESFDPVVILHSLSDICLVAFAAATAKNNGVYPTQRLVQLCPPQWAVTDEGIASYADFTPSISLRLQELTPGSRSLGKIASDPLLDIDSLERAADVARQLLDRRDPWGQGPPF